MSFEGEWCHREKRKREREGGEEVFKIPNSFCYFIYFLD